MWIMNTIQWTSKRPVAPAQPLPLLPRICNCVLTRTLSVSAWSQDYAATGEHRFQTGIVCTRPDRPAEVGTAGPECTNQRSLRGNWEGCACVCQPRAAHFVLVAKVRKKPYILHSHTCKLFNSLAAYSPWKKACRNKHDFCGECLVSLWRADRNCPGMDKLSN